MNLFEITLQRQTHGQWPITVEHVRADSLPVRAEGRLELDRTGLLERTTPEEYGLVLGRSIFREDVRDAFARALAASQDRLHVLLSVEDSDLRTLRWERLCAPINTRWQFLLLNSAHPLLALPAGGDRPAFSTVWQARSKRITCCGQPGRFGSLPAGALRCCRGRAFGPHGPGQHRVRRVGCARGCRRCSGTALARCACRSYHGPTLHDSPRHLSRRLRLGSGRDLSVPGRSGQPNPVGCSQHAHRPPEHHPRCSRAATPGVSGDLRSARRPKPRAC